MFLSTLRNVSTAALSGGYDILTAGANFSARQNLTGLFSSAIGQFGSVAKSLSSRVTNLMQTKPSEGQFSVRGNLRVFSTRQI